MTKLALLRDLVFRMTGDALVSFDTPKITDKFGRILRFKRVFVFGLVVHDMTMLAGVIDSQHINMVFMRIENKGL